MSDHFGTISITPPATAKPAVKPVKRQVKQRPEKRQDRPGKASPKEKNKRPYYYFLLPILILPVLYSIIGFWIAPWYLSKALTAGLSERTGMSFTLDDAAFNPFSFNLSLQGIKLKSIRGEVESQNLLAIDKIEADLAPMSLLRNDLVSNALRVNGLELTIIRTQDNHYNFEEILDGRSPGTSSDMMSFSELPFLFSLNNISIRESMVTFQDIPSATTHTLEEIELDLPTLSNFPFKVDEYIHPRFSTVINGSKIELTGQAAIPGAEGKEGLETKLSCNIHALDLPLYSQYLPNSLPLALTKGKADGVLQLNFTRGAVEGPKMAVSFSGELVDLELTNKDNSLTIALPTSSLVGTFQPISRDLHIQRVILRQPHFITSSAPSPDQLPVLLAYLGKSSSKEGAESSFPPVAIDLLEVENGDLAVTARDSGKKPAVTWSALQFKLKDFAPARAAASTANKGIFSISGETPDASMSFSWQGKFNDNNVPEGLLNLDNIPASVLFSEIGLKTGSVISGKANLQGTFSLVAKGSGRNGLATNLTDAEIDFQGLKLATDKNTWLDAPIMKISGVSKKGSHMNFGSLHAENAALTLRRGALPDIFTEFTAKKSPFSMNKIDYSGKITVLNASGKALDLTSVHLKADNLQSTQDLKDSLILSAKVDGNGIFKAKGAARLSPFQTTLSSGFSGIDSQTLFPWFTDLPLLTEAQGVISGKGVLTFPATSFSGQLRFDSALFGQKKNPLLSWNSASFEGFSYTRAPFHLGISLFEIDRPVMTWHRDAHEPSPGQQWGTFLQGLLPEKSKSAAQAKESISISQLDIQDIRFKNGELHYRDNRLVPAWNEKISDFSGQLSDLHSASAKEQSRYTLSGRLQSTPFIVEGSADFFSRKMSGRSVFKISDFPLRTFGRYLPDTLGIDSSRGSFSLDLSTVWGDANISHNAQYLFKDIHPVSHETDTALTLALLKNSDQHVELSVAPPRGGTEAESTLVSHTITTFQRQLIKTKVSPLLLASGDFTDLVGNEYAEFLPGGYILSEKGHKTLSRFASFLAAHPAIGLQITGCADKIIDGNALKSSLKILKQSVLPRKTPVARPPGSMRKTWKLKDRGPGSNQPAKPELPYHCLPCRYWMSTNRFSRNQSL
jgi:hypothetical protein